MAFSSHILGHVQRFSMRPTATQRMVAAALVSLVSIAAHDDSMPERTIVDGLSDRGEGSRAIS